MIIKLLTKKFRDKLEIYNNKELIEFNDKFEVSLFSNNGAGVVGFYLFSLFAYNIILGTCVRVLKVEESVESIIGWIQLITTITMLILLFKKSKYFYYIMKYFDELFMITLSICTYKMYPNINPVVVFVINYELLHLLFYIFDIINDKMTRKLYENKDNVLKGAALSSIFIPIAIFFGSSVFLSFLKILPESVVMIFACLLFLNGFQTIIFYKIRIYNLYGNTVSVKYFYGK